MPPVSQQNIRPALVWPRGRSGRTRQNCLGLRVGDAWALLIMYGIRYGQSPKLPDVEATPVLSKSLIQAKRGMGA